MVGGKNNIKEIVSAKNRIVLTPHLRLPALLYPPADWFGWMAITVVFYFSGARDHAHQSPLHLSRSSFPAPASSCQSRILSPHLSFFAPLAYSTDTISICLPAWPRPQLSFPLQQRTFHPLPNPLCEASPRCAAPRGAPRSCGRAPHPRAASRRRRALARRGPLSGRRRPLEGRHEHAAERRCRARR